VEILVLLFWNSRAQPKVLARTKMVRSRPGPTLSVASAATSELQHDYNMKPDVIETDSPARHAAIILI